MRSLRCDRCGFVQAERATCRKCGYALAVTDVDRASAFGGPDERARAVGPAAPIGEPELGLDEAEQPRYAVGGGRGALRARSDAVAAAASPQEPPAALGAEVAPVVVEADGAGSATPVAQPSAAKEARPEPSSKKAAPEPIARIRSVPLTASLDAAGHVMVEFQCRKCDRYGVLLVPPDLMEAGIEGECGACHRSAPMTRVELEGKRFDRYDG